MKKAGNDADDASSAAAPIHPVNVRVGGFYRLPRRDELLRRPSAAERAPARTPSRRCRWWPASTSPTSSSPTPTCRSAPSTGTPSSADRSCPAPGSTSPVREFEEHVVEEHVEHSTALHATFDGGAVPRRPAGPLQPEPRPRWRRWPARAPRGRARPDRAATRSARIIVRDRRGGPRAGRGAPAHRRLVRARPSRRSPRSGPGGDGHGATEAPRGLLYHRYAHRRRRARSSTRRSSRRRRRTRRRSRPTCARSCRPAWTCATRSSPAVRAGDPQLRPVHLLRDPLPGPAGGAPVSGPGCHVPPPPAGTGHRTRLRRSR